MSSLWSLIDELAPLPVVLETLHNDKSLGWPSLAAQDQIASWFSAKETYPLPPKYLLALMKALEKDISTTHAAADEDGEEQFSDEFLSYFLTVRSMPIDEEDSGFQQFEVRGSSQKLPIAIKRSHNQVGTKVWSAGLLLAEILQHECGYDSSTSLVSKCFVELGAGVGISSLLWFYSLPPEKRMTDLVITDYAWSVIVLVDRNIEIARSLFGDEDTDGNIRSALMDWAMLTEDDRTILADADCLLAADCTYSPDLNTLLVQLFQTYFQLRLPCVPLSSTYPGHASDDPALPFNMLLQYQVPFVVIACTLRNEDTFNHFVQSLNEASNQLAYLNVTARVHAHLHGREMYYVPDRHRVEVFCIFPACASASGQVSASAEAPSVL